MDRSRRVLPQSRTRIYEILLLVLRNIPLTWNTYLENQIVFQIGSLGTLWISSSPTPTFEWMNLESCMRSFPKKWRGFIPANERRSLNSLHTLKHFGYTRMGRRCEETPCRLSERFLLKL